MTTGSRTSRNPIPREGNIMRTNNHDHRRPGMAQRLGAALGALGRHLVAIDATLWAKAMIKADAVILDTETTDLRNAGIIEIALISARTGERLYESLVDPGDKPINPDAAKVHGITPEVVTGAPLWSAVLPEVLKATEGRLVLAYNKKFDIGAIRDDCARYELDPQHLGDDANWGCLMLRLSDFLRITASRKLNGGHRAVGDAQAARKVLLTIARKIKPAERNA
ncbi:3'-5' exonuclease [Pseudonocardiaceae bacterium YIM PH 21723]|nr:3'-5' exonuclease [Pseudonocardiaceae bacterium YIM PH 21723]